MQMDEQVECSRSDALSLTPRLIAVTSESLEPKTVSTVFCPIDVDLESICASRETVKTVLLHSPVALTAINRGVNENVLIPPRSTCSSNCIPM
jgi:hypothetical protein